MMISRRTITGAVLLALLLLVTLAAFSIYKNRINSTQYVTIRYVHSHDVVVYDTSETQNGKGNNSKLVSAASSGETLKLKRNLSYTVLSKGDSGFEDKRVGFLLTTAKRTIAINPYYSSAKLNSLAAGEFSGISQALGNKYPNISLYQIQPGKLYHWADWYGTALKYTGSYKLSSDTLKVVLHKEAGVWVVKTNPPNVSLSKYVYPAVPVDILSDVNNAIQFNPPPNQNLDPGFTGSRPVGL